MEFEFMWREGGWNILWLEIVEFESKVEPSAVFVCKEGITTTYYHRKALEEQYKRGWQIYSDKKITKKLFQEISIFYDQTLDVLRKELKEEKLTKLSNKELDNLLHKTFWHYKRIGAYYALTEPWMAKKLEERIREELKSKKRENYILELLKKPEKAKELLISEEAAGLIKAATELGKFHFRLRGKEEKAMKLGKKLIEEIARRFNKTTNQIESCTVAELSERILNNNLPKEADGRTNDSITLKTNKGLKVLIGEEAKRAGQELIQITTPEKTNVAEGQTASPGKARGAVRIIIRGEKKFEEALAEMKKGEILVTTETTPAFTPIIDKAAAIVTEVGGITTHAAIISRELGIPCIVGAKAATRIFKDGDFIEVDAEKGLVRKIK